MLRTIHDLKGYTVSATDGNVGHITDCYFDDEAWVLRYFVVDTGDWLMRRRVLISPLAIAHPGWAERSLVVALTRQQIEHAPDIDTDKPVSRQHESQYLGYYGYPYYWGGTGLWGNAAYPGTLLTGVGADGFDSAGGAREANSPSVDGARLATDQHLRSCKEVSNYRVHAIDGDLGQVEGLIVEERSWSLRYMIVNTGHWWAGHSVLISPEWIDSVSWINQKVSIDLTRQSIRSAPVYDSTLQLNRDHELGIYKHYGRSGYWNDSGKRRVAPQA